MYCNPLSIVFHKAWRSEADKRGVKRALRVVCICQPVWWLWPVEGPAVLAKHVMTNDPILDAILTLALENACRLAERSIIAHCACAKIPY